eukprot:TRINITY_DN377_c0_g1_i1.p1 TRINITY_DN377_c0_g1~~TRINITY_DN377_c0_g1_i1.p1  ORF type:complete len:3053 (-),score=889.84 TRINITY_DN377_c0_g1_i1:2788-10773(-)
MAVSRKAGLPVPEECIRSEFDILAAQGHVAEAAKLATSASGAFLRTQDTIKRLAELPGTPGQLPPVIRYFSALMDHTKLNAVESVELTHIAVQQQKLALLDRWLQEDKLTCTEELGDEVIKFDKRLGFMVYLRVPAPAKVVRALADMHDYARLAVYVQNTSCAGCLPRVIADVAATTPDSASQLVIAIAKAGIEIDMNVVVDIFMEHKLIKDITAVALEVFKNAPEYGALQTRVLELNFANNFPAVSEALMSSGMFSYYDRALIEETRSKLQQQQQQQQQQPPPQQPAPAPAPAPASAPAPAPAPAPAAAPAAAPTPTPTPTTATPTLTPTPTPTPTATTPAPPAAAATAATAPPPDAAAQPAATPAAPQTATPQPTEKPTEKLAEKPAAEVKEKEKPVEKALPAIIFMSASSPAVSACGSAYLGTMQALLSRYAVTKHTWHGKYGRIFCLTGASVATLNPQTLQTTNTWEFRDITSVAPNSKVEGEFTMTFRKLNNKTDTVIFSSPMRAHLLSDFARLRRAVSSKAPGYVSKDFVAASQKLKRSGERKDTQLSVTPWGLCQLNPVTGVAVATYFTVNIDKLAVINDLPGGFALFYGTQQQQQQSKRMYVFICPDRDQLLERLRKEAESALGLRLNAGKGETGVILYTFEFVQEAMRSIEGDDQVWQTLAEFQILKHTPRRHPDPQNRIVTLSDRWLVERRPSSFAVSSMRPLDSISWIVRCTDDVQSLVICYADGTESRYMSTARDSLISCILDCARSCGNKDLFVTPQPLRRGLRNSPFFVPVDPEAESNLLQQVAKFVPADHPDVADPTGREYFAMLLATFNANVPYSGFQFLDPARNYKLCIQALNAVLQYGKPSVPMLQTIRRLVVIRPGFEAFSDNQQIRDKLLHLLQQGLIAADDMVNYTSLEVIASLLAPQFDPGDRTSDDSNKRHILSYEPLMSAFMAVFAKHLKQATGALVVMVCIDILTYALCEPFSDSTEPKQFDWLLEHVAKLGRDFFRLFHQNHCLSVVRGAGMLMKSIIEEGGDVKEIVNTMQYSALVEGATLRHLHSAVFNKTNTQRQLLFQDLSCTLVGLWTSGHAESEEMLSRIFPQALLYYLESTEEPPADANRSGDKAQKAAINAKTWWQQWQQRKIPKRKALQIRPKKAMWPGKKKNWAMFFHQFRQNHLRADLIWNNNTRDELREALETELRVFRQQQELTHDGFVSWNYKEFIVPYDCLNKEVNVGGFFLRLLLNPQAGQKAPPLRNPAEFFDMLFHRCLLERDIELQAVCIQAMATVYKFYKDAIGQFRDLPHIVTMLRQTTNRLTRDRLMQFLWVLVEREENAKKFIDCNGIPMLVEFLTLVHVQAQHIVAPLQSNLLTVGPEAAEGEWYYSVVTPGEKHEDGSQDAPKKERFGPKNMRDITDLFEKGVITRSTLCWAQGMEDWKPLHDITQLKWTLLATGSALFTYYELATLVLEICSKLCSMFPIRDKDGGIIRPVPRPKRQLSSPQLLPHVVQVLLTADPKLFDKTCSLVTVLMEDNAAALPKLYLTGVFYFALLYMGSNVENLSKFLKATHLLQHFKEEEVTGEIARRSILGTILPPAMVHLIERRGTEEFGRVYLGNFDTPEAIWNHDMRHFMVEKLSVHLGTFPQRLGTNAKAVYQYVPLPPVVYRCLDNELFCHHYYLRNFCDLERFPLWPVESEVELMQCILNVWAKESEKKPPGMSEEECCGVLDLKPGEWKEDELRRAYFRKAAKYHPDKNPEGRATFEKIHEAYTILSANKSFEAQVNKLHLIIKSQSILYVRFRKELAPYKYAGYTLLIKDLTTALSSDDKKLLNLTSELCYRTIQSSTLNAEELRGLNGIEIIATALDKCVEVLTPHSLPTMLECETASYLLLGLSLAASYERCRGRIALLDSILNNVCFCLRLHNVPKLIESSLECVCCFSLQSELQQLLFERHILFLVLPHLFKYDHTLNSAAVDAKAENNTQHVLNIHAGLALLALGRLGGFDTAAPPHALLKECTTALITPYIAGRICQAPMDDILRDLTSNVETPLCIWNNATRQELLGYIEENTPGVGASASLDVAAEDAKTFVFKTLAKELNIGGVYVRVYNEQLKTHGKLPDSKGFCQAVIAYFTQSGRKLQKLKQQQQHQGAEAGTEMSEEDRAELIENMSMAAQALVNLLKAVPGIDVLLASRAQLSVIFALLSFDVSPKLKRDLLAVVVLLTKNVDCVNAIVEANVLGYFLPVIYTTPECALPALTLLHSLLSNSKVVASVVFQGGLLYLLRLFASATERGGDISPRVQAAAAMSKMSVDQIQGSRAQLVVQKFIPRVFLMAMKQDPEGAVHMYDASHENPELIWNASTRTQLREALEKLCSEFYAKQVLNVNEKWSVYDDFQLKYEETKDELQVGGVFIRLFLQQPTWALSDPKSFAEALAAKYIELYTHLGAESNPHLEDLVKTVATATVGLLAAQPPMAEHLAKTGHLNKLFSLVSGNVKHPTWANVVQQFAGLKLCVETMSTFPCINAMREMMEAHPNTAPVLVDALERMINNNSCGVANCLVFQIIQCDAVPFLLKLLEGTYDGTLGADAAEVKARAVNALQAAEKDESHGAQLTQLLDASPVWANYRGQRHDLFLTGGTAIAGLLTGGSGGAVGLLTETAHNAAALSDMPPDLADR